MVGETGLAPSMGVVGPCPTWTQTSGHHPGQAINIPFTDFYQDFMRPMGCLSVTAAGAVVGDSGGARVLHLLPGRAPWVQPPVAGVEIPVFSSSWSYWD